MALVKQGWFAYGHLNKAHPSACWIRIYDLVGDFPDPCKVRVAVFSELPRDEYEGLSVTNGAEHIATDLWKHLDIHPDRTIYVEHYPDERPALVRKIAATHRMDVRRVRASAGTMSGGETFDLVSFIWRDGQASKPAWTSTDRDFVERLIGKPFK